MAKRPAKNPCGSCPYRKDVPSGIWHESEYQKLPGFDQPTMDQPPRVFHCHQQDGRLCAGWAGCHDMSQSLGLRIAVSMGFLSPEELAATLDYETTVPLFASGAEAAEHGMRDIERPDDEAIRRAEKLRKKLKGKVADG